MRSAIVFVFCDTFSYVPIKFSYVFPCVSPCDVFLLYVPIRSDWVLIRSPVQFDQMYQIVIRSYTFCATVMRILQKVQFPINFDLDLMVMGPAGPFNEQQTGGWTYCAKSRSLLSSHAFCYKFLCVPGCPVSFRTYGIQSKLSTYLWSSGHCNVGMN